MRKYTRFWYVPNSPIVVRTSSNFILVVSVSALTCLVGRVFVVLLVIVLLEITRLLSNHINALYGFECFTIAFKIASTQPQPFKIS